MPHRKEIPLELLKQYPKVSSLDIATTTGCSETTILTRLKEMGLATNERKFFAKRLPLTELATKVTVPYTRCLERRKVPVTDDELRAEYIETGLCASRLTPIDGVVLLLFVGLKLNIFNTLLVYPGEA